MCAHAFVRMCGATDRFVFPVILVIESALGDGVTQLLERWTQDRKTPRFEPRLRQEHKKNVSFFKSKMFC